MVSDDRGFTLLELLVAITVFGFLLAGLGGGIRFGVRAADTQARLGTGRSELDATDRLLRRMIEGAEPGTDRTPAGLAGGPGQLVLRGALPLAAGGGLGDVAVGLDAARRLVLRWTPHRHVAAAAPVAPDGEAELLRGVSQVEFAFWDGESWRAGWAEKGLPRLVRVRLRFPAGDPRHWPDIVAAPARIRAP